MNFFEPGDLSKVKIRLLPNTNFNNLDKFDRKDFKNFKDKCFIEEYLKSFGSKNSYVRKTYLIPLKNSNTYLILTEGTSLYEKIMKESNGIIPKQIEIL